MNSIALLLLTAFVSASANPQIDCFLDNQECEIGSNNLLHTYMGITTMEECTALCEDELLCIAFTHFGIAGNPMGEACLLFSGCASRVPCEECITGSSQTECFCSIDYFGHIDNNNFVDLIGGVESERDCKIHCVSDSKCELYTFYNNSDPINPNTCFLLSNVGSIGLQNPVKPCEHCVSGPSQCETNQKCQVAVITNGSVINEAIFAEESMNITLIAKEKDCHVDLNIVAIGGGGGNPSYYRSRSGLGSGQVETAVHHFSPQSPVAVVQPGKSLYPSFVEVDGGRIIEAAAGGFGNDSVGGVGFSGGGGCSISPGDGGDGGSNGENGENGTTGVGGQGSGVDLGMIMLHNFELAPGKGGLHSEGRGGGGGGVLVDGKKPSNNTYMGEGFGGGAGGKKGSYEFLGSPGCVLIEF